MVKKIFILSFVAIMLASCSNEQEIITTKTNIENYPIESFKLKIDSLNAIYSNGINMHETRGYVTSHYLGVGADAVGSFVGGKIFSWAGSAIGAACGNPIIAVGGYLAGRKFGSSAGSAVASIGAAMLLDRYSTRSCLTTLPVLNDDYIVNIENPDSITDGELHNLIVVELLNNIDKYVLLNGELNYELILEDAYKIENRIQPYEFYEEFKKVCMENAIEQTKRIVNSSRLLAEDNGAFLDQVFEQLIPELNISKTEFDDANLLSRKVLSTYIKLDSLSVTEFSKSIDSVIDSSELNTNLKSELKSSNSIMRNSKIIWSEVK